MTAFQRSQLSDFQLVDHPGAQVLARPEIVPWVRYVLESGSTLHAAAGVDREAMMVEGREPVFVVPAKLPRDSTAEPDSHWAIRRFARGGRVLPRVLGDRYLRLGTPRPFHEARVSEAVRRRGVPTPRVLAAAVYSHGAFYRGDLVTEFVPGASDLVEALFDSRRKGAGGALERAEALKASGGLVKDMARAGLFHRDLHAGNVLLRWKGVAPQALILDLDLSRITPEGTPTPLKPMARRLMRSIRKWESRTGIRLTDGEWSILQDSMGV